MSLIRNITKKALVVAVLYAGKRIAARIAGKVAKIAAKRKSGTGRVRRQQ
jgi:hypothetical protein